jgi:pimeloyl-ACP methyl ester carboxylesterase
MTTLHALLCAPLLFAAPHIESRLEQVGPAATGGQFKRSANRDRAVILLHGFILHLNESSVTTPVFRSWQRTDSVLVRALRADSDVFSYAYAQNGCIDDIVRHGGLREAVATVRKLGYREIVLLGHSAGGVIARQLVEDHPDCGVTRVIQVCSPNGGTPTARTKVFAAQQPFLDCLTPEGRQKCLEGRAGKRIPANVEFVCVLGHGEGSFETDGVVPCSCQWSEDLRKQGVPVVPLVCGHHHATRLPRGAEVLARLVRDRQPRWEPARVEEMSRELFKK